MTYIYMLADIDFANLETKHENSAISLTLPNVLTEEGFVVGNAYPNPFNPKTVITMQYAVGSNAKIYIYNSQGNLVKKLLDGFVDAGSYEIEWNASDMPSGVYIIAIRAEEFVRTQKVVLLK